MASISTQRANSFHPSPSNAIRRKYDVFLSFRGEDTRGNFLEYLYRALRQKGILTFRDNNKLNDGEDIKSGISKAIEDSRFSIVVLSVNYASSSWCLDELVQILQCKRTTGHIVYPVFYHVEPSEVRKRKSAFGTGFDKAAFGNEGKVEKWIKALREVANSKGWAYPSTRFENEAKLIDDLVHKIFNKSVDIYPFPAKDLVGIRHRMVEVIKLLQLGSVETRVVGLLGMGGIGKSTLAKVVYDSISWQFEGCSFIDNVRENLDRSGVLALQEHLISDILLEKDFEVRSVMRGINIIQNMVCRKKVLIVLDDVSEPKQLENLLGELHWFSPGSRIIITTQNQHVLTVCGAQNVFNVKELKKREAIELFKSKAFAKDGETGEFLRLIGQAVQYAKGVPLALEILGSSLLGETVTGWESALARLRESNNDDLQQVLRISYNGLHWTEKEIFLDIACFFKGMQKDSVTKILASCGFNPVFGINVLVKKSLLTISADNKFWIHDLIQKMGWSIVDAESRKSPGERSRLWRHDDVQDVLMDNTGTKKVEGIIVHPKNIKPRPDVFAKMTNLRILMIHGAWCSIDLPNKLRLLIWNGCPLKCMPSTFQPKNLVELRLTNSHIEKLWDRTAVLPKLTLIDLGHSMSLSNCPDFTCFPNLEDLVFEGCIALVDLHPSIKKLRKLIVLNMKGCSSLRLLPCGIESQCLQTLIFSGCSKLTTILECFGELKQLSWLNLDRTDITELPQSIGNFTSLSYLNLSGCISLKSIPSSIAQLKKLKQLILNGCYSLTRLPEEVGLIDNLEILHISFSRLMPLPASVVFSNILKTPVVCLNIPSSIGQLKNLKHLLLVGCYNLSKLPEEVGLMDSLEILDVSYSGIEQLPASVVNLKNLQKLGCKGCTKLKNLSELLLSGFKSLTMLDLTLCRLKAIPESIGFCLSLKTLHLSENYFESLPTSITNLTNLKKLLITECKNLQELPELPSSTRDVLAFGCQSLKTICNPTVYRDARNLWFAGCSNLVGNKEISILMEYKFLINQIKENKRRSSRIYTGPGSKLPEWTNYKKVGGSITLHLPIQDTNAHNLLGLAFSAVVATKNKKRKIGMHMEIGGKIFNFGDFCTFSPNTENVITLFYPIKYFTVDEFHSGGTVLEICFVSAAYPEKRGFYTTAQALKAALEVKEYETGLTAAQALEPTLEIEEWGARLTTAQVLEPALEVKECGARLVYEEEVGSSEGINDYQTL